MHHIRLVKDMAMMGALRELDYFVIYGDGTKFAAYDIYKCCDFNHSQIRIATFRDYGDALAYANRKASALGIEMKDTTIVEKKSWWARLLYGDKKR